MTQCLLVTTQKNYAAIEGIRSTTVLRMELSLTRFDQETRYWFCSRKNADAG